MSSRKKKLRFDPNLLDGEINGVPMRQLMYLAEVSKRYKHVCADNCGVLGKIDKLIDEFAEERRKIIPKTASSPCELARHIVSNNYAKAEAFEIIIGYLFSRLHEEVSNVRLFEEEEMKRQRNTICTKLW